MKIELDNKTIDKLVGKRIAEFNKTIRSLENKLETRDKKIEKLSREIELLKASLISQENGAPLRIAKIARCLVGEMQRANWVPMFKDNELGLEWTADDE